MGIAEFLKILKTKIPLLIIFPLLFGCAAAAFSYLCMTNNYTSSVSVYVLGHNERTQKDIEQGTNQQTTTGDFSLSQVVANDLSALAKSSKVKEKVNDELGINNAGSYNIKVKKDENSRVITISATGKNPSNTADVVNATAKACAAIAVEQMNVDAVNIIEEAKPATSPSGPNRKLITFAGAGAGLFFALVLIILISMLDTTIKTSDDLKKLANFPILTKVPYIKKL